MAWEKVKKTKADELQEKRMASKAQIDAAIDDCVARLDYILTWAGHPGHCGPIDTETREIMTAVINILEKIET